MSALSPSALAAMRLNSESDSSWTRPRRQTNPDLAHRPSVLLRQATRRSADVSSLHNTPSSPLSSPLTPGQRPRTSGSVAHTHTSAGSSSATVTPTKRHSTSSHRSSLSASALSNPALAEIPSRKYNALRLSTGSVDGSENNNNNSNSNNAGLGTAHSKQEPCAAAPRDPAAANATANPPATSNFSSNYSSYFPQSSPGSDIRPSSSSSASTKRVPTSRSSFAFQDRLLRPHSKQATLTPQSTRSDNPQDSPSIDAVLKSKSILKKAGSSAEIASPSRRRRQSTPLSPRSGAPNMDAQYQTPGSSFEEASVDESTDDTRSRSDDVFLNIAKSSVSDRRDSLGKLDRRRKLGLSTRSSLAKEQTPSPEHLKYQSSPLYSQNASPLFTPNYSTSASAHPLDDNSRLRYLNSSSASRSVVGVPRSRYNNDLSPELPQLPHPDLKSSIADARFRYSNVSNLSSRTVRQSSTSDGEKARHDGTTESSLSTTAPSTVWDELDDLKSRIRKLELTGKFPSSSAAAMSSVSGERPRTAATTATTLSSSPKQKHTRKSSVSLEATSTAATANSIQTLLQSALVKAKGAVGTDVFNALEATAADALTLTNMLTSTPTPTLSPTVSTVTGTGLSDRQAKRKADSLCRGLTELCLALTEEQTIGQPSNQQQSQDQARPVSRHQPNSALDAKDIISTRFRRSMSHEPETSDQQDPGSRMFSRMEGHRANTINLGSSGRRERLSHDETSSPQTPSLIAPTSRLHRLSGSHRLKREDDSDERASVFSRTLPSRAMTEVGGYSQNHLSREDSATESPSTRFSTPYQQTLSQQPKISPSVSSITQRRSYATPPSASSGIPSASGLKIQPGFRRYGSSTVAGLSDRGTSESPSQTGETSSPSSQAFQNTRISIPSSKMATSYTAIQQQPQLRNGSVGPRRFGLRSRPSTIGTNNDR